MRAIIPGSFDPVTIGHVALAEKAREAFDGVTVLLCRNFGKHTLFTFEERLEMLRAVFEGVDGVDIDSHSGWLYEYLNAHKPCILFKGIRNTADFEYEKEMAIFNFEHSGVDTCFVLSDPKLENVSSTKVRELLAEGGEWKKTVPQNAQKIVEKFYKNN